MVKSHDNSIMRRLLTLIMAMFLAVTLLGCHDPVAADNEAEHLRLGNIAKQQLRQRLSAYPLTSQTETFHPAP
ncbi:MAG: hypothetical protein IIC00_07050 [Planctomycetes bacterium]|nr:hypothetical protein [Planctomycetota bacterium]